MDPSETAPVPLVLAGEGGGAPAAANLTGAVRLSVLLETSDAHRHAWSTEELRDMLRHQLRAPLRWGLGPLSAEVEHQLQSARPPLHPLTSLADLFQNPQPPLELLRLVKSFAK